MTSRYAQMQFVRSGVGTLGAMALMVSGAIAQEGSQLIPPSAAQAPSLQSAIVDPKALTPLEQSIVDEMNLARQNPEFYAELLMERRQHYNGLILEVPGQVRLMTQEGVAAVDEAIASLQDVEPLPPLTLSPGMSHAAADHALDLAPGRTGHISSDGSLPANRISEYGTWSGRMGENISYGSETARDFVLELIIDDGVPSRGHRETMFHPDYVWTGVGCDRHAVYRTVCVIDYASGYQEANPSPTASDPAPVQPSATSNTPVASTSQPSPIAPPWFSLPLPESRFRGGR